MSFHELFQNLPKLREWIDVTVAAHRSRARPTEAYGFTKLSRFYSPALLKSTRVVEVDRLPLPPLSSFGLPHFPELEHGDFGGITYHDHYFLLKKDAHREALHFHELVHVTQWQHLGADQFLRSYALGYLKAGGYRDNPFEVMAYKFQDDFEKLGALAVHVEPLVRQELDVKVTPFISPS